MNTPEVVIHHGDAAAVLAGLPSESIHACVTDPPYGIRFMGKAWDTKVPAPDVWREVLRVAVPGAHLLCFAGTRTVHRMACAIEDAGWEIRDMLAWLYGSGFPKNHDVSKAMDRAAGAERPRMQPQHRTRPSHAIRTGGGYGVDGFRAQTKDAQTWNGWGTALKPAMEPIILARKPIKGTVAQNVLRYGGAGALNIDGCRVGWASDADAAAAAAAVGFANSMNRGTITRQTSLPTTYKKPPYRPEELGGRWPANVLHDGSEEVVALFPQSGQPGQSGQRLAFGIGGNGILHGGGTMEQVGYGDAGSAARFFYCAKAQESERRGSKHHTVKPTALMRYLVRLITPPGRTVLDPFAGTGTTGEAALAEGCSAILIELDQEHVLDSKRRIVGAQLGLFHGQGE